MRAVVQVGYGTPDVLALRDVEAPRPGDRQVLVRVHTASVNALDWHTTRGMPYLIRGLDGLRTPRQAIRGVDLSGSVEAVGKDVAGFAPGDEVFGGGDGSFAELAVSTPERLARKPAGVTHEQAATLNVAGLTALQALQEAARLQPPQRVLIHGAGGGVGTFAVQIAKWLGAHVTAVTRTESVETVRSLGADEVIDHRSGDFTRRPERWDVIADIGGGRRLGHLRRVLERSGVLVVIGAPAGRWLAPATRMLQAVVLSPFVPQRLAPFFSRSDAGGSGLAGGAHRKERDPPGR
ncbi:MAG TPA: NAD(P)-dependent alcohol dehydrogenase [Thermoanaerobaculia bacterium]|nr:NAD(P)-dependent alcohol dehydrogenase [Thermoanaerobaculia bacterium]